MAFIREHIIKRVKRSKYWPKVRKAHLKKHPYCAACGRKKKLEVHHIIPFKKAPELELDQKNLITLCSHATECHLSIGHLGDFKAYNPNVVEDSKIFLEKVKNRKYC